MKREIYHRGPITCSIPVPDALLNYTGGVFEDTTGAEIPDHVISVTGYGVDRATGKKYWQIRNSWGTYWGEEGFFRVIRGQNNLVLENGQYCDFAIPENVWDGQEAELQQHIRRKSEPQTPREPFMSQLFKIIADFVAYAEGRKAVRRHEPCATLPRFVNGEHVRVRMTEETDIRHKKNAAASELLIIAPASPLSFSLPGHTSTWIRLNYPTSGTGGTSLGADSTDFTF